MNGVMINREQAHAVLGLLPASEPCVAHVSHEGGEHALLWVDVYRVSDDEIVWQGYVERDGTTKQ